MMREIKIREMSFFSHKGSDFINKKSGMNNHTTSDKIVASALLLTGCPPAEPVSSWS